MSLREMIPNLSLSNWGQVINLAVIVPGSVILSIFIIYNRNSYPLKQNSPYLATAAILSTALASLTLFIARCLVFEQFNDPNHLCMLGNTPVLILSYFYMFTIQMPVITSLLRKWRVLTAHYKFLYRNQTIVKIMKSETKLLIIACIWSLILVMLDFIQSRILDLEDYGISGKSVQLYQFFCEPVSDVISYLYFFKYFITVSFALPGFWLCKNIPDKLYFKDQFRLLLYVVLSNTMSSQILQSYNYSSTRSIYYQTLLSNLVYFLGSWFLLGKVDHSTSSLPVSNQWEQYSIEILIKIEQAQQAIKYFFEANMQGYLYYAYRRIIQIDNEQYKKDELLKKLIEKDLKGYHGIFNMDIILQIRNSNYAYSQGNHRQIKKEIIEKCKQSFRKWDQKKLRKFLNKVWKQNDEVVPQLERLNLHIN